MLCCPTWKSQVPNLLTRASPISSTLSSSFAQPPEEAVGGGGGEDGGGAEGSGITPVVPSAAERSSLERLRLQLAQKDREVHLREQELHEEHSRQISSLKQENYLLHSKVTHTCIQRCMYTYLHMCIHYFTHTHKCGIYITCDM